MKRVKNSKFKAFSTKFANKIDRRVLWFLLGLISGITASIVQFYPAFVEALYSETIFVAIRWLLDHTFGLLPFSVFYGIILLLSGFILYKVIIWLRFNVKNHEVNWKERILYTLLSIGSFLGIVTILFFMLWGYNYFRIPVDQKLGYNTKHIDSISIVGEINYARKAAIEERQKLVAKYNLPLEKKDLPKNIETHVRQQVEDVLASMNYSANGKVPVRYIKPDGFLNGLGVSGFYNPFLGEVNLDASFSTIYLPFLMAHEMAHGYGFAREGEANFIAYLACEASTLPAVSYSGRLTYLLYLTQYLDAFDMKFTKGILQDIRRNGYFKSQPKYDQMIVLVNAWRKLQPVRRINDQ